MLPFPAPSIFGRTGFGFGSLGGGAGGGGGLLGSSSKCQRVDEVAVQPLVAGTEQPQWTCGIIVDGSLSCLGVCTCTCHMHMTCTSIHAVIDCAHKLYPYKHACLSITFIMNVYMYIHNSNSLSLIFICYHAGGDADAAVPITWQITNVTSYEPARQNGAVEQLGGRSRGM
jgi:hypothetical protein